MFVRTHGFASRKLVALDGVRGIAILSVLLFHSYWRLHPGNVPEQLFAWLMFQGWAGVDLFFVLSGFLITGILLDSRLAANYFQSFYARRALRIFPLYFAFLAACFCVFPFIVSADWLPIGSDRWIYLCYLTNWQALWHGPWRHSVMAHLWSLAVEEQFYFCWPLVVWLVRPRNLLGSLLIGEAAVIAGRIWWVLGHGASQAVAMATITRMDGLLLGAICAIVVRRYRVPDQWVQRLPLLAGGGLVFYLMFAITAADADRYSETAGFPLLALSSALLVLYAVLTEGGDGPIQRFLRRRRLTQMGKYAYGLYVYHVPLFYFGDRLIDAYMPLAVRNSFLFGCAASAVLIVAAYQFSKLSYNCFERYFLSWKDRFEPRYDGEQRFAPAPVTGVIGCAEPPRL